MRDCGFSLPTEDEDMSAAARLTLIWLLLATLATSSVEVSAALAQENSNDHQEDSSGEYRFEVFVGPVVSMDGFVHLATMDQGHQVNQHIEIFIWDQESGERVTHLVPRVTVEDWATGSSRTLDTGALVPGRANVHACRLDRHRDIQPHTGGEHPHLGDNLYLLGQSLTVTVEAAGEAAEFDFEPPLFGPVFPVTEETDSLSLPSWWVEAAIPGGVFTVFLLLWVLLPPSRPGDEDGASKLRNFLAKPFRRSSGGRGVRPTSKESPH